MTNTRTLQILLVEDSEPDARMAKRALDASDIGGNLTIVRDGQEALNYLFHRPPYEKAPQPDLILLDLNLPRKDGREVLEIIKVDETTRRIPVVVLTGSKIHEDILRSYNLHANSYITKPVDFNGLTQAVTALDRFWFHTATLPNQ